jgi:hypothetical protein
MAENFAPSLLVNFHGSSLGFGRLALVIFCPFFDHERTFCCERRIDRKVEPDVPIALEFIRANNHQLETTDSTFRQHPYCPAIPMEGDAPSAPVPVRSGGPRRFCRHP